MNAPTVGAALEAAGRALRSRECARRDAPILLAHVLGVSRTALAARPETPVAAAERARFDALLARRVAGEPLAWLTGRREFWSLEFEVNGATLVPRPETEHLVEAALEALADTEGARAADLGTGCGAIAVVLAREVRSADLVATDIDPESLEVAWRNVRRLAPGRVELRQGSWCEPLEPNAYSLIVSNPPYVRDGDPYLAGDGVLFEPRHALVGGESGLDAIRSIVRGAWSRLRPGGRLIVEHGAEQGPAVRKLLRGAGYRGVASRQDLGGRERVAGGTRPVPAGPPLRPAEQTGHGKAGV